MLNLLRTLRPYDTVVGHRAMSSYTRLVRFLPRTSSTSTPGTPLIGEPVDSSLDVGTATSVEIDVFSGASILDPGSRTGRKDTVDRILSPLTQSEVGTIRCIGLNVCPLSTPTDTLLSPPRILLAQNEMN